MNRAHLRRVPTMSKLLWIAFFGALGAIARYGLAGLVQRWSGDSTFPFGTLAVNALGCLIFGFLWEISFERFLVSPQMRLVFLTGFVGAFTTYSTFSFETGQMIRAADWTMALLNVGSQTAIGLSALFVGYILGRLI